MPADEAVSASATFSDEIAASVVCEQHELGAGRR